MAGWSPAWKEPRRRHCRRSVLRRRPCKAVRQSAVAVAVAVPPGPALRGGCRGARRGRFVREPPFAPSIVPDPLAGRHPAAVVDSGGGARDGRCGGGAGGGRLRRCRPLRRRCQGAPLCGQWQRRHRGRTAAAASGRGLGRRHQAVAVRLRPRGGRAGPPARRLGGSTGGSGDGLRRGWGGSSTAAPMALARRLAPPAWTAPTPPPFFD